MADKEKSIPERARERFKLAVDAESHNRTRGESDIKFARLGEQWPANIKSSRESEGRPCLTINKMPAFLRQIVNDARQNKPSIKTHPIDSNGDPKTAEILNGIIRNIEISSNADIAYDTGIDFSTSCGFGYWRVTTDYTHDDSFDLDILINRVINPFTIYVDPKGTEGDGSDWEWAFVTEWITKEEFKSRFGEVEISEWDSGDSNAQDWMNDNDIRVAEYWERNEVTKVLLKLTDGNVMFQEQYDDNKGFFDSAGITIETQRDTKSWEVTQYWLGGLDDKPLETNKWKGTYIPIVPVYGEEVYDNGKVHYLSAVHHALDSQRMFNYWRTTTTELVALAPKTPYLGKAGAFESDKKKWDTANTKNHPYIEYDGDDMPQRQQFASTPAGALQEALNASDDMKSIIGIHDASLGARSNETSGKAILARQREGDVSTFHFIDNMNRAIRQTGRILVDLIPKVYDKPRMIRIIGEDDKPKNVQINQEFDDNGEMKVFDITTGKYDVSVSTGGSYTTQRQEGVDALTNLVQSYPAAAPILGDVIVKMMDFPNADKVSKRLAAMLPSQIQQMESEENKIPEEAQMIVGQLQQQMQALQNQMQQGMQAYKQMQQENDQLKTKAQQDQIQIDKLNAVKTIDDKTQQLELAKVRLDSKATAVMQSVMQPDGSIKHEKEEVKPTRKRIQILAPSGGVYQGVIEEEAIEQETPEEPQTENGLEE
jgi:hypothetical protein